MRKAILAIALVSGLISVGSLVAPHVSIDGLSVTPATPASVIPVPDGALQAAVNPVTVVLSGKPVEARKIAGYFADFAEVAKARPDSFKVAGSIREHHNAAAKLYLDLNPASVPGFQAAVDGALKAMLGDEDQAIEPAKVQAALIALSWASAEAAK